MDSQAIGFLNNPAYRQSGSYSFELVEPLDYLTEGMAIIQVPAGFRTDLASVPRALWAIFPPHGRHSLAAILHDWLCVKGDKRYADKVFDEALLSLGVTSWKRRAMVAAVRLYHKVGK